MFLKIVIYLLATPTVEALKFLDVYKPNKRGVDVFESALCVICITFY